MQNQKDHTHNETKEKQLINENNDFNSKVFPTDARRIYEESRSSKGETSPGDQAGTHEER